MSSSPPLGEALPKINKFVGESFGSNSNVRTIYAGAEEDRLNRDSRVILLIGPAGSGKSSLIDFLCNYFYGAALEENDRYHIAGEKFGSNTPDKSIITYVFNDTIMDYRPIVIDTPGTGQGDSEALSRLLNNWVQENGKLRIDVVGIVFSSTVRMTTSEENELQKTMDMFPPHLRSNFTVFITGSDGSPKPDALLRRFNLQETKTFKVNTSCLFQRKQNDSLQEHLRGTYWRMTTGNFTELFFHIRSLRPMTFTGAEPELPFLANVNRFSSRSSSNTSTVIHYEPTIHKTVETKTTTISGGKVNTTTSVVKTDNGIRTEEKTTVHPPFPVYEKPNFPPPPPPPPPPLPMTSPPKSGLPFGLLQDIQKLRQPDSSTEDDVVVVEYDVGPPEVVIMKKSPTPPHSTSPKQPTPQSSPPRLEELPPPLTPNLSRPYDFPPTDYYKMVTVNENGTLTRFSSSSFKEGTRVSIGANGPRYDEVPKNYSVEHSQAESNVPNVTTTYSTVAFMNENGSSTVDKLKTSVPVRPTEMSTLSRNYNPYERAESKTPETPSTVILRTPAAAGAPSLSSQMRHSFTLPERTTNSLYQPYEDTFARSQSTRRGEDIDVVRYIYDVGTRSHKSVGIRSSRSSVRGSAELKKRESKSLETITRQPEKPYYEASGYTITRTPQRSLTSLHHLSVPDLRGPELVHSEDNYAYIDPTTKQPKTSPVKSPRRETQIDFPMPNPPFKRNDETRKSMRSPPGTGVEPISPAAPIPARRTSAPMSSDRRSQVFPPPPADTRENPTYSISGGVHLRNQPGRHEPRDTVSRELRERDDILRQTTIDVNRQSYPALPSRIYENVHPPWRYQNVGDEIASFDPRQSQIGQGVTPVSPNRNSVLIPQQMRENRDPIEITIGMIPKGSPQRPIGEGVSPLKDQNRVPQYDSPPKIPPHGYRDQDYGDNWDLNTTQQTGRGRRREEGRTQGQRPPDLRIGEEGRAKVHDGNDPRSPAPPPYQNRPYPNTPDAKGRRAGGDDSDDGARESTTLVRTTQTSGRGKRGGRYGYSSGGGRNGGQGGGIMRTTTTTTETTRGARSKKPEPQRSILSFKVCSCATTRDCLLNVICFIVAPLFVIAVIITIIVVSVTAR